MKGKISLVDFIKEVKRELREAVDTDDPFFIMGDVELEVSFVLDVAGKGGVKLLVAEVGAETKATQTHKVKLTLTPYVEEEEEELSFDSVKESLQQNVAPPEMTLNRTVFKPKIQPNRYIQNQAPTRQSTVIKSPTASKPQPSKKNPKAKYSPVTAHKK